jgi:ketosteroid isomerase-like protein
MKSDNSSLIKELYQAFNRGEIEKLLAAVTEDVEWDLPGGSPLSGFRHGRNEVGQFFAGLQQKVRMDQFDADEILADGDKVVVLGRERGTVKESGRSYSSKFAHVFTLRNGQIASVVLFGDSHAIASAFGESTREREALTGPLGVTQPPFSGGDVE